MDQTRQDAIERQVNAAMLGLPEASAGATIPGTPIPKPPGMPTQRRPAKVQLTPKNKLPPGSLLKQNIMAAPRKFESKQDLDDDGDDDTTASGDKDHDYFTKKGRKRKKPIKHETGSIALKVIMEMSDRQRRAMFAKIGHAGGKSLLRSPAIKNQLRMSAHGEFKHSMPAGSADKLIPGWGGNGAHVTKGMTTSLGMRLRSAALGRTKTVTPQDLGPFRHSVPVTAKAASRLSDARAGELFGKLASVKGREDAAAGGRTFKRTPDGRSSALVSHAVGRLKLLRSHAAAGVKSTLSAMAVGASAYKGPLSKMPAKPGLKIRRSPKGWR